MIRDLIERFLYRLKLWSSDRRQEYFDKEMKSLWKLLIVGMLIFGLGLGLGIAGGIYYGEATGLVISPYRGINESHSGFKLEDGYTLFTWARSRKLCFAIVPRYRRAEFANNWFAKCAGDCGMSRLEEELGALPPGTIIEWTDWPDDWGGAKFGYPQDEVTKRFVEFAKAKKIQLTFSPGWLE